MSDRIAKYTTVVYPRNRHAEYGKPVVVFAGSRQEAVNRAVDIGWAGFSEDARVLIQRVEDVDPRECPQPHVSETEATK